MLKKLICYISKQLLMKKFVIIEYLIYNNTKKGDLSIWKNIVLQIYYLELEKNFLN